jgi:hypothetical protein
MLKAEAEFEKAWQSIMEEEISGCNIDPMYAEQTRKRRDYYTPRDLSLWKKACREIFIAGGMYKMLDY